MFVRLPTSVAALALLLPVLLAVPAAQARPEIPDDLPQRYRDWLEEVELLISKEETRVFLELEEDYQRDGFIDRFWAARDPYPGTERNEFKESWDGRVDYVLETFGNLTEERAKMVLKNGEPTLVIEDPCDTIFWPAEIWYYERGDRADDVLLFFYQRDGGGSYRAWRPLDGAFALMQEHDGYLWERCPRTEEQRRRAGGRDRQGQPFELELRCFMEQSWRCTQHREPAVAALNRSYRDGQGAIEMTLRRIEEEPEPREGEWLANMAGESTELPEGAELLPARFEVHYPGRRSARTVVQGILSVPREEASTIELQGRLSYDFQLTGEVLKGGKLFETFRYRFDLPAENVEGEVLPLVFQRLLRPGTFELRLKLEDLHAERFFRHVEKLEVPKLDRAPPPPEPEDPETAELLAEVHRALDERQEHFELIPPEGDVLTGMTRFESRSAGYEIDKVSFYLNGELVFSRRRPPYGFEVDLGPVPRLQRVRATAFDADGRRLATDEIEVNTGQHRFAVRLVEPERNRRYERSLLVRAEVDVPEGERLDRVELYLGEERIATLYQPPWEQAVYLDRSGELTYVRAQAFLDDGNSTEEVVFVNAPDNLEEIDVQLVEVFASVVDDELRPVSGLGRADFAVFENGVQQKIQRFEQVDDLPLHAAVLFDNSSSMAERLDRTRSAAVRFFEQIVTPKDRAAVITFNDRPNLAVRFTNEVGSLAEKLAVLDAERGTALWDAFVFTLEYFNGIKGQRAILLLSDGKDESSRYTFQQAQDYALAAGVTVYSIGLGLPKVALETRYRLGKLAELTGGRAWFIDDPGELEAIYAQIERELRSRYLLAYQSSDDSGSADFRPVEVRVLRPDLAVEAMKGYFP